MGAIPVTRELRTQRDRVINLIKGYRDYHAPLIIDRVALQLMFALESKTDNSDLIELLFHMYQRDTLCYTQEILVCLCFACEATWQQRAELLFGNK